MTQEQPGNRAMTEQEEALIRRLIPSPAQIKFAQDRAEMEKKAKAALKTLRDEFAMAALTGILSGGFPCTTSSYVADAYYYADAMLLAREGKS